MEKRVLNQVPVEKIIQGFSNKNRVKMIEIIEKNPEISVDGISKKMKMDFKTVSFHLSKLSIAGIALKKYAGHKVVHKLSSRGHIILKFLRILE